MEQVLAPKNDPRYWTQKVKKEVDLYTLRFFSADFLTFYGD